jgi:trans-2,3-dihydro-3-hydroxyanthranilate isomerase
LNKTRFYIVDVFAERKYAGNQLAVFRNAGDLSSAEMQSIAREMNYSETTFILDEQPGNDNGYAVRIFTPAEEVPFAGHPTLGTAHVIHSELLGGQAGQVTLNLKVGPIPVTFSGDGTSWMRQVQPTFGPQHSQEALASVLGLEPSALDGRFPIEEVSTGLPFFIVPLQSLAALRSAATDRTRYFDLIRDTAAKGILVFCPETHEPGNDLSVRVFVDYYGVPEDPATGSANGCLAAWLVRHRYTGAANIDLRVEQGYEIGRPSLLLLRAKETDREIEVNVGGKSITVAAGEFV